MQLQPFSMDELLFLCSGPAHWSTTVTVTPECRPREPMNGSAAAAAAAAAAQRSGRGGASEQDRMALIAFADGVQVRKVMNNDTEEKQTSSLPFK